MTAPRYTDPILYRRLLLYARPFWPHIVGVLFLSLLSAPLALMSPLPLKLLVDSLVGSQPIPDLLQALLPERAQEAWAIPAIAAGLMLMIMLLTRLQNLVTGLLQTYIGGKLVVNFRARLFDHVQRLSLAYHDAKGTADSLYHIENDARSVQELALKGVIPFLSSACTLAGMLYVTAQLQWQLALVTAAMAIPLLLIIRRYHQGPRSLWATIYELDSAAMSVVQESLAAVRVVKVFGHEDRATKRFTQHADQSLRKQVQVGLVQGRYELLAGMTMAAGLAAALFIGARQVQAGALTLGELLLVMSYLNQISGPLRSLSTQVTDVQSTLASAARAFAVLDELPDVVEGPNAQRLERATGAITFRNVYFAYADNAPVLKDISLEIKPGTRVGIAGPTGAGKTTLVSLLTRFYDPSSGCILLDGVDLREYRLADLRNQFAVVLQEPVLFSASIAENIAYGRPSASEDEIVQAAWAANIHDFIVALPQRYGTEVGERGMRLSGGERQRVALARAFLKDAPILILDEPTSSVDVKTEAGIMDAMDRLMKDRTTFIIAHRLNTLQGCDLSLVLEQGQVLIAQTPVAAERTIEQIDTIGLAQPSERAGA
jgi:ATP-binding cassette, subfamily B, bacterial